MWSILYYSFLVVCGFFSSVTLGFWKCSFGDFAKPIFGLTIFLDVPKLLHVFTFSP